MIFFNYFVDVIHKSNRVFIIRRYLIYIPPHSFNLLCNIDSIIIMNDKIKLHLCPINMFIIIHNHTLYTTASYNSNNLQYPNSFIHL